MTKNSLLIVGAVLIVIGIIGLCAMMLWPSLWYWSGGGGYPVPMMRNRNRDMMKRGFNYDFSSNGERIYYTATSRKGKISASMGSLKMSSPMMDCVDCHGQDGRGGRIEMPMGAFGAANIKYEELTKEEKPPFTDKLIKRAITKGLDQKGRRLNPFMPRWKMGDANLDDLLSYLKTL